MGYKKGSVEDYHRRKTKHFTFFLGDETFAAGLAIVLLAGAFLAAGLALTEAVAPVTA